MLNHNHCIRVSLIIVGRWQCLCLVWGMVQLQWDLLALVLELKTGSQGHISKVPKLTIMTLNTILGKELTTLTVSVVFLA